MANSKQKTTSKSKTTAKAKGKSYREPNNRFNGADDIYLTKNKIAVTTVKTERRNNVNETVVKTRYYNQNDENFRALKKQGSAVRIGRKGTKFKTL
ncbi:MAG: hypothetical protein J6B04_05590 [Clostridia bacterium]|nr:hypothetical protein [Clostridia bacterium]